MSQTTFFFCSSVSFTEYIGSILHSNFSVESLYLLILIIFYILKNNHIFYT